MGHVSGDQEIIDSSNPTRRQPPRQQETEEVKCPRCDSTNTKFCYYNNYNKSQPRHFCKSCKRHWTKGGTLRTVPFGGGRKNKRPRITNSASTSIAAGPTMGPTFNTLYTNKNTEAGPTKDSHLANQNAEFLIGDDDKKDVTSMIYEALIGPSLSPLLHETTFPVVGNDNGAIKETGEFQFSSLGSSFDVSSFVPSTCGYDQFGGNFDSMEESTVTSVNVPPGTSNGPWPGTDTGYWDWNEIDVLTSADHLDIAWDDDAEIKP